MKYIDYTIDLYNLIKNVDVNNLNLEEDFSFRSFINGISGNYSSEELISLYRKDLESIIDTRLTPFCDDIKMVREVKKVSYFENVLAMSTCFVIFWLLENKKDFSKDDLSKISDSIYLGSIGYRLFDVHYDSDLLGKEAAILGNYMLHLGEELLIEVLGYKDTFKILNNYLEQYTLAEFLEKRNRWKPCPFNWDEPEKIALKAAPIFSIFELIFRITGLKDEEVKLRVDAIKYVSAISQFMDDLMDAREDLIAGVETLVMKGYYEKYGVKSEVTDENILQFLNEERRSLFYNTIEGFFEKSRENLTKTEDSLLLLYLEMHNNKFYRDLRII